MPNIVPKAEGIVTELEFAAVKNALANVVTPALDGKVDMQDAIQMGTTALIEAVPAVRNLPDGAIIKVMAAALVAIASEITTDLVVVYPEEEAPA